MLSSVTVTAADRRRWLWGDGSVGVAVARGVLVAGTAIGGTYHAGLALQSLGYGELAVATPSVLLALFAVGAVAALTTAPGDRRHLKGERVTFDASGLRIERPELSETALTWSAVRKLRLGRSMLAMRVGPAGQPLLVPVRDLATDDLALVRAWVQEAGRCVHLIAGGPRRAPAEVAPATDDATGRLPAARPVPLRGEDVEGRWRWTRRRAWIVVSAMLSRQVALAVLGGPALLVMWHLMTSGSGRRAAYVGLVALGVGTVLVAALLASLVEGMVRRGGSEETSLAVGPAGLRFAGGGTQSWLAWGELDRLEVHRHAVVVVHEGRRNGLPTDVLDALSRRRLVAHALAAGVDVRGPARRRAGG